MSFTRASFAIPILILIVACGTGFLVAQTAALAQADLYIIFLHQEAWHAGHPIVDAGSQTAQLHVSPTELAAIFGSATQYIAQETSLRKEAIQYYNSQKAKGLQPEHAVVVSHTARRQALAAAAMANIQSVISPSGFAGVQRYLNTVLQKSIQTSSIAR